MDATRWRVAGKQTFSGAGWADIYVPAAAGDVLNIRQLAASADAAVEFVFFFGSASGSSAEVSARDDVTARIWSHEPPANGGGSPDFSCLGAWSPTAGRRVRLWVSAACDIHYSLAGVVEP